MNLDYSQNRQRYIDIAKGILIICVVIGHVLNFEYSITTAIKTIIYTFHMPAFFIISGLLTNVNKWKNQSLGDFIKRKIKRLIIPYILFEIIGGIIQIFLYGFAAVNPVGILYGIVSIHCSVGADWFLPTLFLAELLMLFCIKFFAPKFWGIVAVIDFILAFITPDINYTIAVIRRILIAFGFIILGVLFKKYFVKKDKIFLILSFILVLCIAFFNGCVDLSSRTFNNPLLYLLGGTIGTYFTIDFSQFLFGKIEDKLEKIGQESLLIMGTHQHIMMITNLCYGNVYSIFVQIILLPIIALYEYILLKVVPFIWDKIKRNNT